MKPWTTISLVLLLSLPTLTHAHEISGIVHPHASITEKVAPFLVQLNGGEQTTFVRSDGLFRFRDVAPGHYFVTIPSTELLFSQYDVDVAADGHVQVLEAKYLGAPLIGCEYPLVVEPVKELEYFEPREKFNILGLIMNPSFLTIIVPIGLLYVLPKLTEGMDPEDMKKAQEEMGSTDPSSLLAGMLGGGQANAEDSDDD
uniref:ER membrane protein complex subunit 7 beta-sandwich domain-containing protein n=1 Tax=Hyaloperonospora arabidopsidis (strain Emoy2) TaxID=559515 RepID=M4C0Z7_HYAAE